MELPLQLTFRGLAHSDAITNYVERRVEKLDTFFDHIISCRIAVESPHRHKHEGYPFRIRIELGVPGDEIVVSHDMGPESNQDAYAAIDATFDVTQRRLQDYVRQRRGDVKQHERARHGTVVKVFTGYGFIATENGDELYFHKNSVLNDAFDWIHQGTRVRFAEEIGDDGMHASSVLVLHAKRHAESESV